MAMKSQQRRRSFTLESFKLMILSSTIVGVGAFGISSIGQAEELLPAAIASYPTGTITGVYETTFQINGRTVSFASEAVIVDRHGDPLPLTAIRVDLDVKYRIQKGTTDKIEWMLLILPE